MRCPLTYCARLAVARASRRSIYTGRVIPKIDEELSEKIIDQTINLKKIRTRRNMGMERLPPKLNAVCENMIERYGDRRFRSEAKYLINVISDLKVPDDDHSLKVKKADIKTKMEVRDKTVSAAYFNPAEVVLDEDYKLARSLLSDLITGSLEMTRRDWHYYEYDQRASYMYLAARMAPNYACIRTVMKEIHGLDPSFEPRSVLDFGSGMGTVYWAVEETWPRQVSEFMNVDISKEQQHLAESLLRGGSEMGEIPPGIFHRQYLPASNKVKYDLVVAAFSMLEQPNRELRANIIENLWHKTNDFLVIIERGNRGGFKTINEARHLILDLSGHDVTKKINLTLETRPILKNNIPDCHVFAPCSHEFSCPRADMTTKKNRDVCRFRVFYEPLSLGEKKPQYLPEDFSYIVLRKGPHPTYIDRTCPLRWPRIVEKRKKSGGMVTHRLCCPNGTLSETTTTKSKYGKATFELAKSCDWGDILPIKVCDTYVVKKSFTNDKKDESSEEADSPK